MGHTEQFTSSSVRFDEFTLRDENCLLVQNIDSIIYTDALASLICKLETARVQSSPKPASTYKHAPIQANSMHHQGKQKNLQACNDKST